MAIPGPGDMLCSFCGEMGPVPDRFKGPGVRICDDCVEVCSRSIKRSQEVDGETADAGAKCSFCGSGPPEIAAIAAGREAQICDRCLAKAKHKLDEEFRNQDTIA